MNRSFEAFLAAQRIIDTLESYEVDIHNPESIIYMDYEYFPTEIHLNYGASRLVLWDENYDYVIKIPLSMYDEKYCQHEVEIYAAAVDKGLEHHFGWCECFLEPTDCSVGIYVMEYLDGCEDLIYHDAWTYAYEHYCEENHLDSSSEEIAEDYINSYDGDKDNEILMDYFKSEMDIKEATLFERFIDRWHINDLHVGNYLLRNNKMVICDYAGWGW